MGAPGKILERLAPQVRLNSRRSDAAIAGHFSLCGLLMRLRNLNKWESSRDPWWEDEPESALQWVTRREELWLSLEGQKPGGLEINGCSVDPFDIEAVNRHLGPTGFMYGAGLAGGLAPVYFLGKLESTRSEQGLAVHVIGEELTQDILFLPGLRQGDNIFLRKEPLAYLVWDKLADPRRSLARFLEFGMRAYGVDRKKFLASPGWEEFKPVLAGELEAVLWHELGEAAAGRRAEGLLSRALEIHPASDLEHFVRGVKDLMADTCPGGRLDRMAQAGAKGALGFYPAWLSGFPRMLFPEIDAAVMEFMRNGKWEAIDQARRLGCERSREILDQLDPLLFSDDEPERVRQRVRERLIGPFTGGRATEKGRTDSAA